MCEEYSACQTRTVRPVLAGQFWPIVRASNIVDNDIQTFDWDSCRRKIIAKVQGTSGKTSTTRSVNKDLNWYRIPENSWSRTVLHDKAHWRDLTIYKTSDMSWMHFTTRSKINWFERLEGTPKLDPCWKSQPVTCKVNMEWKLELKLWTKTILTRGSEFHMNWTSWSQIWSTKSTTTTSRKSLKRRRKYLRWKRKYLRLQVNPRQKQNQEDLQLLAHPQELHLFVKEYGWILNQKLNPIKRTQWQKD